MFIIIVFIKPSNLSELIPIILYMKLTHLGSDACKKVNEINLNLSVKFARYATSVFRKCLHGFTFIN